MFGLPYESQSTELPKICASQSGTIDKRKSKKRIAMKTYAVGSVLLVLFIMGCASIKDLQKTGKFEEIAEIYEDAVRWSDFHAARAFVKQEPSDETTTDTDRLKQIKVTAYSVKRRVSSPDSNTVNQVVEISYYWLNNPVVKSLTDRQVWEYDHAASTWHLTTGLPDFK